MKNWNLVFLFILSIFLKGYSQGVFSKVYDNEFKYDYFQTIRQFNNTLFITGKTNYWPDSIPNSWFVIADMFGNEINQFDFHVGNGKDNFVSEIIFSNHNVFLLGSYIDTTENPNVGYNSYIYQLDENFDSIRLDTFNMGYYDRAVDFLPYQDGFLLLGYVYNNVGIDYNYTFLSHVDTLGNIVNTWQFGDGLGYHFAYDFKPTPDGGFIVGGETDDYPTNSNGQFWLMKIDSNINVQWYKEYGSDTVDEYVRTFNYIELSKDGSYLFGGEQYLFENPWGDDNNKGRLFKVDSLGNLEWNTVLKFGGFTNVKSIRNWNDAGIIVAGGVDYSQNPPLLFENPRGYLAKYTPDGEQIIWQRYFSKWWNTPPNDDYVGDMILTSDGGILVSGYQIHDLPSRNDGWLIKFDSCGFTTGAQPQALFTVDSIKGPTVYLTNLSEEYCTAYLSLGHGDSLNIYAYSQYTIGSDPTQIQYTFADTGTYYLTLYTYAGDGIDSFATQVNVVDTTTSLHGVIPAEAGISISLFPNPAKDYFILQADFWKLNQVQHDDVNNLIGEIYTTTGQKVQIFNFNPKLLQQQIFLNELPNGVYFVSFTLNGLNLATKRVSVVK